MAVQTSNHRENDDKINEFDEEIDETEDDLIENYLYLTQRCGVLKHSSTTNILSSSQQQRSLQFSRQFSWATDEHYFESERTYPTSKSRSSLNDFNNNNYHHHPPESSTSSRIPPTIYYHEDEDDEFKNSFSLVKLFARMKARLKHDRRYRLKSNHELLHEEDPQEWFELTKNIRSVLTHALLPDGGYDALVRQNESNHSRRSSQKRSREYRPVLAKDVDHDDDDDDHDHDKIQFELDDSLNTEGNKEFDEVIWQNFRKCSRGGRFRRCGVCKAVDRQQYQGQLVYVYGVANNILIDENLKASGLG